MGVGTFVSFRLWFEKVNHVCDSLGVGATKPKDRRMPNTNEKILDCNRNNEVPRP